MTSTTSTRNEPTIVLDEAPVAETTASRGPVKMLNLIAIFAIFVGAMMALSGIAGAAYVWGQAADQGITTPDDASIPSAAVRGPLTMKSQMDIITAHQLDGTDGLYYAEMPREVAQVDEAGNTVIGDDGEPVMVANAARASWLNATALTTSLGLGVMAYGVSAMAFVLGFVLIALGWAVRTVSKEIPQLA